MPSGRWLLGPALTVPFVIAGAASAETVPGPGHPCFIGTEISTGLQQGEDGPDIREAMERLQKGCLAMEADRDFFRTALDDLRKRVGGLEDAVLDAETRYRVAYLDQQIRRLEHERSLQGHQDRIFDWQLVALQLVTFITVLMTLAGLVIAAREIPRSLRPGGKASGTDGTAPTQLELGPGNVSVTTAAAWVVMLALALGYLYLFVHEVMDLDPVDFGLPADSAVEQQDGDGNAEAPGSDES